MLVRGLNGIFTMTGAVWSRPECQNGAASAVNLRHDKRSFRPIHCFSPHRQRNRPANADSRKSPPQVEAAAAPSPITNPSLRLDPALGLVVIQFRNDVGTVTTSIPSEHQLRGISALADDAIRPGAARHEGDDGP